MHGQGSFLSVDQSLAESDIDGLGPIDYAEGTEDRSNMDLDGPCAQIQFTTDLLVRHSVRQQAQDIPLPSGQFYRFIMAGSTRLIGHD